MGATWKGFCGYQNLISEGRENCKFCTVPKGVRMEVEEHVLKPIKELSLWGVLRTIDLLITLAETKLPSLQTVLMDSDLLRMIIRLSIESSSLNAVMSHKILQNVLRMRSMNDFILENAVNRIERNPEFYPV